MKVESLRGLYEKDFYLWVQENLKLLRNKEYDLVDWENLLEEIEDMGQRHFESMIGYMAVIMEHLYKWENFKHSLDMGHSWIDSVYTARERLVRIFKNNPSLKKKAKERNVLQEAWEDAVYALINWFKRPKKQGISSKLLQR
jgi:hypothetical protein